jgi:hypothetical protein
MDLEPERGERALPVAKLISAMERAAQAGWPETARLAFLLMTASLAAALILLAWR